jgi:hypothetical protein
MAEALAQGLPVLVGVNGLNQAAFDRFADGLAQRLPATDQAVLDWADTALGAVTA